MAKITPPDPRVPSPCMCVIVLVADPTQQSPCHRTTPGSDIPFCGDCEDRHPFSDRIHLVTTKPLPTDKEHVHDQR